MAANLLSFDFIRGRLSAEQLADLAVSLGICLDCGGNLVSRDGEIVCGSCGLVWAVENTADHVPFPEYEEAGNVEGSHFEGHWQPGTTLAFLKGLGDPVLANGKGKALMRVLAKSVTEHRIWGCVQGISRLWWSGKTRPSSKKSCLG